MAQIAKTTEPTSHLPQHPSLIVELEVLKVTLFEITISDPTDIPTKHESSGVLRHCDGGWGCTVCSLLHLHQCTVTHNYLFDNVLLDVQSDRVLLEFLARIAHLANLGVCRVVGIDELLPSLARRTILNGVFADR